ncbi:MAG: carbohydrate ABC transporter permease [Armatimonadota bacterium]|jgi:ABC-type glycerol-3-phosphate transport system permease component|nr:carbohydrate ABC transporter permease [Fimbriimonadaceae bacterium]MCZ8138935.1 carbohydrate ABC transporter permease [Fimbriimonadaceae bacterium]
MSPKLGVRLGKIVVALLLASGSIVFLLPFYTSLSMSLKTPEELATTSAWSWPQQPTWSNYSEVLTNPNVNFLQLFLNTVIIAGLATIGVIASSSLVAYAFAKMKFMGRDRLFVILLSTMMLPAIVTMIPTYFLFKELRWINTILPLTVPAFFGGGAFNIFLLRQFFLGIPKELDEAAKIEGAGHWTIYSRIVMPLSGSALATVGIFCFIYNWRDFMGPLIYLNEPEKQTLELGLATYNSLRAEQWHLLMAGSVLVTLPLIVMFLFGQRYFVKGMALSGLK